MLRLGDPTRSLQRPPARRVDVPCPRPVRGFLRPATRFKFQLAQNRSIPRTILRRLSCLHDARSPVSRRRRHSNLKKDGARFVPRCFLRFVCLCDRLLSWACSERRGYVRSPWVITPSLIAQRTPGRRPQAVPPSISLFDLSPIFRLSEPSSRMVTHTGGHHRDSHGSDSSPFEQGATTPGARTGSTSPVVFTPRTSPKSSPVVLTPSSSADDFFNYHLQATQQSEPSKLQFVHVDFAT